MHWPWPCLTWGLAGCGDWWPPWVTADTLLSSVAASGPGSSPHCQRTTLAGGGLCSNPAGALTLDL